jgi:formate dehydrogenase subunit gamma
MSEQKQNTATPAPVIQLEKVFQRFSTGQRWEHWILLISFTTLLLTGLPQKYRASSWSQQLIATPEQLALIQTIHHIAAIVLILEVIYHLGNAIYRMARRNMPDDMFISWQDFRDAGKMVAYLLFLRKDKPVYGKYSFEEKVTYWFIFIGVGIMLVSGLILWFPELVTRFLPGGVIPAAMLAHSTEAIVAGIFVVIWHFFHVHFQRLNLSIFNGKINEKDMQAYHALEYERLVEAKPGKLDETGDERS